MWWPSLLISGPQICRNDYYMYFNWQKMLPVGWIETRALVRDWRFWTPACDSKGYLLAVQVLLSDVKTRSENKMPACWWPDGHSVVRLTTSFFIVVDDLKYNNLGLAENSNSDQRWEITLCFQKKMFSVHYLKYNHILTMSEVWFMIFIRICSQYMYYIFVKDRKPSADISLLYEL